jgi:hypothetical protein
MKAKRKACLLALVPALAIAGVIALNAALAQGTGNPTDIVISEVMFNAITETAQYGYGEWIEIYNKGSAPVDLAGWVITDNSRYLRVITYSMCPNSSCVITPGGCWLIAWNQDYLQAEFNNYTNPLSPTVDTSRTIFLGSEIGNGLANDTDMVALMIVSGGVTLTVDCVSWGTTTPTFCSGLTYVPGGNGRDTNLSNEADGQSITNIGGQWYYHEPNASPYNCINTAAGGSPTAVALSSFSARARPRWVGIVIPLGIFAGLKIARKSVTGWRGKFP